MKPIQSAKERDEIYAIVENKYRDFVMELTYFTYHDEFNRIPEIKNEANASTQV